MNKRKNWEIMGIAFLIAMIFGMMVVIGIGMVEERKFEVVAGSFSDAVDTYSQPMSFS